MSWLMQMPGMYRFVGKMARSIVPYLPRFMLYNRLNDWGKQRELPIIPKQSFREWMKQNHDDK